MDYVFFAFSSLAVSMAILLLALLAGRSDRLLAWRYLIAALIGGLLYYYLLTTIARSAISTYYILNSLPQATLILLLIHFVRRQSRQH